MFCVFIPSGLAHHRVVFGEHHTAPGALGALPVPVLRSVLRHGPSADLLFLLLMMMMMLNRNGSDADGGGWQQMQLAK